MRVAHEHLQDLLVLVGGQELHLLVPDRRAVAARLARVVVAARAHGLLAEDERAVGVGLPGEAPDGQVARLAQIDGQLALCVGVDGCLVSVLMVLSGG